MYILHIFNLAAVNCPIKENGVSEAESIESSDVRDTSADDTTDLDKTLTFDEKMEDSGLDSAKTKEAPRPMAGPPVKIETVEDRKKENSLCMNYFSFITKGGGVSLSYGSWIYNYLCNQCLSVSPLTLMAKCTRYNIT